MDIQTYLQSRKTLVDTALTTYLDQLTNVPPRLVEAMRYSLLAGGKRIRPILVMAGAAAVGGDEQHVMPCACALEAIHTFSLIHDDLPAMDNDDLRRGVPTNHKMFGEAMAILAGDGLHAEAFRWLAIAGKAQDLPAERLLEVLGDIAEATGPGGMVGGQVLDIAAEGHQLTADGVTQLQALKTGALIRVAVTSGAKLVGADTATVAALRRYGETVGLAFQIADDLLGTEGNVLEMGKPVGSDAAHRKATYPAMVGVAAARTRMQELTDEAVRSIAALGERAELLRLLAGYITSRRY